MWASIPICLWPSVWLSYWLLGAATATAYRLPTMLAPLAPYRLRTPLLSLHAQTLKLNPNVGLRKSYRWLRPHLHLVKRDSEAS